MGTAGAPGRAGLLTAGAFTLLALAGLVYLQSFELPYDAMFGSVVYLMWSGNADLSWIAMYLSRAIYVVAITIPVVLISWAIVWPNRSTGTAHGLVRWCYCFVPCWGLLFLLCISLGRGFANLEYTLVDWAAPDVTWALAELEGPLLEGLQGTVEHPWLSEAFAGLYSWVWTISLFGYGPWLALRGRKRAVSQVILAAILAPLLALPFFLLFPVFDPWATNPLYGYGGPGQTAVRYLYPDADLAALSTIATKTRWATGSCLPSLHVAFPLVFALVAAKHRLRVGAWVLGAIAVGNGIGVVYLGRHWITDVILAVPFAFGVHWVVQRIDPQLVLLWETGARREE